MARSKKTPSSKGELKDRLGALRNVATSFGNWKPAGEVLTAVRAHPTIFPLVDRATGVGGWPIQRIGLVHGPSNHGKTAFVHGLGLSFLNSGNFYAFVDAEYTTPSDWLRTLMAEQADHPGFVAMRPRNYEQTVKAVREFAQTIANQRAKGALPPDVTGLIVVDSVRKLVPKKLLDNMMKDSGGLDGASGRGAMMKAALNGQWLDELVPLMFHANLGMVFISREIENTDTAMKLNEPGAGFDYKVQGGKAMLYESSLVTRITRSWVKDGSGDDARIVGERHKVAITKTKVSGKTDKVSNGFFHTSNGLLVPTGFDRARDVLELALDAKVVTQSGSWFRWGDMKWQGQNNAVKALSADGALLDTLEGEAR